MNIRIKDSKNEWKYIQFLIKAMPDFFSIILFLFNCLVWGLMNFFQKVFSNLSVENDFCHDIPFKKILAFILAFISQRFAILTQILRLFHRRFEMKKNVASTFRLWPLRLLSLVPGIFPVRLRVQQRVAGCIC